MEQNLITGQNSPSPKNEHYLETKEERANMLNYRNKLFYTRGETDQPKAITCNWEILVDGKKIASGTEYSTHDGKFVIAHSMLQEI